MINYNVEHKVNAASELHHVKKPVKANMKSTRYLVVLLCFISLAACTNRQNASDHDEADLVYQVSPLQEVSIRSLFHDTVFAMDVMLLTDTKSSQRSTNLVDEYEVEFETRRVAVNSIVQGESLVAIGDIVEVVVNITDMNHETDILYESQLNKWDSDTKMILFASYDSIHNMYLIHNKGKAAINITNIDSNDYLTVMTGLYTENIVNKNVFRTMIQQGIVAIDSQQRKMKDVEIFGHNLELTYLYDQKSNITLLILPSNYAFSFKGKLFKSQ